MKFKFEKNVPVGGKLSTDHPETKAFLVAIREIKEGQSFEMEYFASNHRLILGSMPMLMGKRFKTRKTAKGQRIFCVEEDDRK